MKMHTRTPWQRSGVREKATFGGNVRTDGHNVGPDGDPVAFVFYSDRTPELHAETLGNANLIVEAVNNHAPMLKSLEHCAKLFDILADRCDRWAAESQHGGWSTHQVEPNKKTADDCRRYAAHIRAALPRHDGGGGEA